MWLLEERTLKTFWRLHPAARRPLVAWIKEVENARWQRPSEIRGRYRTADFVGDKVVFDIGGNKYRLIVRFKYAALGRKPPLRGIAFVLFVGTHSEYDTLDVMSL